MSRMYTDGAIRGGRASPPPGKSQPSGPFIPKVRGKTVARGTVKEDKVRPPRAGTVRRATGTGTKVTNIAKHFERIGRDNDRANRRYAVIRGRRARPVATARAKVQILESIKDAINDEEESDGSDSSEADDEGGDEDDAHATKHSTGESSLVSLPPVPPEMTSLTSSVESHLAETSDAIPSTIVEVPREDELLRPPTPVESQPMTSVPPSPALLPIQGTPAASPPVELDLTSTGSERVSILKTLAGFWPQQSQPSRFVESDDPMSDPEHIFRDSSMVVRTDEPTSIIALALKYVLRHFSSCILLTRFSSSQYRDMLTKSRVEKRQAREPKLTDGEVFMPDDKSVAESTSTWGVVNIDSTDGADPTEELRVPSSKLPWAICEPTICPREAHF